MGVEPWWWDVGCPDRDVCVHRCPSARAAATLPEPQNHTLPGGKIPKGRSCPRAEGAQSEAPQEQLYPAFPSFLQ